jgi:hypothetical protein
MVLAFSFLFPFLYLVLANLLSRDIVIMGKLLFSGRETVWRLYFEEILTHPLSTHIGDTISMTEVLYQANFNTHNAWMQVAWEYSLPVGGLFLLCFFLFLQGVIKVTRSSKKGKWILACFCAGMIHMTFESALIVGALDYTLLYVFPLFVIPVCCERAAPLSSGKAGE